MCELSATLANYSHKLAPAVMIRATFLAIRSNKAVTLDIPVCLELMSATEFLLRLFTEIYNTAQLGDGESAQRIVAHAMSCGAQKDGAQPWLLPLFVLSCIPNVLSRMATPDALHIETLSTIIASSFRLSLCLDKAKGATSPEPTAIVCQQFSKILQRKDLGEGAVLLRKSLRASQAFSSQFPQFR
jgi:mediator of RNA polymerase II transcription subunit 5